MIFYEADKHRITRYFTGRVAYRRGLSVVDYATALMSD